MKKALITGVTGQDGSYLAELLLAKGYEVHGLVRRSSSFNTARLDGVYQDPHEAGSHLLQALLRPVGLGLAADPGAELKPDEIYNLGAQSHVKVSFEIPEYTSNVTGVGVARLLEAVRASGVSTRFYQASSSEMFGSTPPPQNETTPFHPRSPYGVAKLFGHWMTVNYREAHNLFACSGILFNHESPRARRELRHPQDHPGGGPNQGRAAGKAVSWATWMPSGTGVMPPSTSRRCG